MIQWVSFCFSSGDVFLVFYPFTFSFDSSGSSVLAEKSHEHKYNVNTSSAVTKLVGQLLYFSSHSRRSLLLSNASPTHSPELIRLIYPVILNHSIAMHLFKGHIRNDESRVERLYIYPLLAFFPLALLPCFPATTTCGAGESSKSKLASGGINEGVAVGVEWIRLRTLPSKLSIVVHLVIAFILVSCVVWLVESSATDIWKTVSFYWQLPNNFLRKGREVEGGIVLQGGSYKSVQKEF